MKISLMVLIFLSLINLNLFSKSNLAFKPDKEQNYQLVENCIQYPDSIFKIYYLPKFDSLGNNVKNKISDDYKKYLIDKIKKYFKDSWEIIFDGWEIKNILEMNLSDTNSYKIIHIIQVKSKKYDNKIQFIFYKNNGKWILENFNFLEPYVDIDLDEFLQNCKGHINEKD